MRNEITLIARLAALISALTFMALLALSIVAFAAERQFLRPAPYMRALSEINAYERAPRILAELFITVLNDGRSGVARELPLPEASQSDVELFLAAFLPAEWVESQSGVVVRYLIADLNREPPPEPAVLSLVALKERLTSAAGAQALLAVIETRPACGVTDLSALTCGFNLSGEIACRPPALNMELCGAALGLASGGIAALLPDEVSLEAALNVGAALTGTLREDARRSATLISLVARFGWLASLPFLVGLTLFGVRSLAGWLRWWGAPLLGAGVILAPLIALTFLSPVWFVSAGLGELAHSAPQLAQLIGDVTGHLSRVYVLQLSAAALLLGITGTGMLALSLLAPSVQRWIRQG